MLLDLATSTAALTALIAKHPLLPAHDVMPSADGISVHLHGGFADFEAWREALAVPADTVTFHPRESGSVLRAETEFASVPVMLIGYSGPVPQAAAKLQAAA